MFARHLHDRGRSHRFRRQHLQTKKHDHPSQIVILEVRHISFNYGSHQYFKGLRNISLHLGEGEILGIVGKSGSGKTTLLKCIYGLEDLQSGEIWFHDEKVLGPSYHLIPGHEDMKLVSQDFYVLDNHTVEENIFDKLIGFTDEAKQKRADKIIRLLELAPLKKTRAKYLSSGQKQRVAIARALAIIPKVLLLDEPFSNLDHLLTEKLFAFIVAEVRKNKTSVILITHLAEEALKYADNIAVIDNGRISQTGKKWEVYYKPANTRLAGLLGEFNLLKKADLERSSRLKFASRLFLRPDKIKALTKPDGADLQLTVVNCTYNGKCYELLTETKNGNHLLIYSSKEQPLNRQCYFAVQP